jgi:ribonucleoside-diphosphate reductase alpha chain
MEYQGLRINLERDSLFDEFGLLRLRESYMREDETSPQHRFAHVSKTFGSNLEHAQRLYDYASKHWLSYATPVLSFGRSVRGQPISCFLPYLHDSSEGLVTTLSEVNWLSMMGGGIGIGVGIRSSDEKSTGVMPHLKTYDASSLAYRQGTTRRGSYATYLDIDHPDIISFLEMRKPTGDPNMRCLNLHHGVNISDAFMQKIEACMNDPLADDSWDLVDPASLEVRKVGSVKDIWQRIMELRMMTGEPYLHYIDTSNRHLPQFQKDLGLSIKQSNLCSEIVLPTNKDRTAVCCLSSVNVEKYDEWKDNKLFLADIAEMLDNVLQHFIDTAPDEISRAKYSASRERSIGVGALGLHSYFQSHMISFDSDDARKLNKDIFRHIRRGLNAANLALGELRGEAPDAEGTGYRFSHLMAVAPNASSSIIMGNTSPSVEAYRANIYRQDTLSGSFTNRNKHLDKILKERCEQDPILDYNKICSSIMANSGSVQHLTDLLSDHERDVFKTAMEISQQSVVDLAADRQAFIDQAQSINLFFPPDVKITELHKVHFNAWKSGLKTLYYCRSEKIGKADNVSKSIERDIIEESMAVVEDSGCAQCEG